MKITILTGSPRKNGTSNYMADELFVAQKRLDMKFISLILQEQMLSTVLAVMLVKWVQNHVFTKTILLN